MRTRITDLLFMGLRNLFRRKARTILTVVGVVIGTVSIVVMISVGFGVNDSFDSMIMSNGSMTVINVSSDAWEVDEQGNYTNTKQKLNDEVLKKLLDVEHIKTATPYLYYWASTFASGEYNLGAALTVLDMDCYEEFGYPPLEDGTYPNSENSNGMFYFGPGVDMQLYKWSGMRPQMKDFNMGKDSLDLTFSEYESNSPKPFTYRITPDSMKMIQQDPSGSFDGQYNVFIDIRFFRELMTKYANTLKLDDRKKVLNALENYETIKLNVDSLNNVTMVQDNLKEMGYRSESSMQYMQPLKDVANVLQLVLGAIGAIAMLVSAINIANTMIMSIYERTKEIGVMKVLGCKVSDIRLLFLFEAGMIGLIGGIIGIGLSFVASFAINSAGGAFLLQAFGSGMGTGEIADDVPLSVIPIWLPFFGAGFAMLVGLLSGFFPAVKATRVSAIEAMKASE